MNENKQVRYYLPSYIAEYIQDKAFKRHISQVDLISEAIWLFQAQRQKEGGNCGVQDILIICVDIQLARARPVPFRLAIDVTGADIHSCA